MAQIPQASLEAIGSWIAVLAALLGVAYLVKQLFFPGKPIESELVTRRELERSVNAATEQVGKQVSDLQEKVRDLTSYTHSEVHKLKDTLHAVELKIAGLQLGITKELEAQTLKLMERIDGVAKAVAELRGAVGQMGKPALPGEVSGGAG